MADDVTFCDNLLNGHWVNIRMLRREEVPSAAQGTSLRRAEAGAARQPLFGRGDLGSGSSNSNGDIDLDFDDSDVASAHPRRRTKKEIELDEIRKKLAYLNWKRMENETQIREILHTSKRMEERDLLLRLSTGGNDERAARMRRIIKEEVHKPLSLPQAYVRNYEDDKEEEDEKYLKRTAGYIESVNMMQLKILSRGGVSTECASGATADGSASGSRSSRQQQDQEDLAGLEGMEQHLHQHMRVLSASHKTRR